MHLKSKEAVRNLRPLIKKTNHSTGDKVLDQDDPVPRSSNIHNMDLPSLISEDSNEDESSSSNQKDPLSQSITQLNKELRKLNKKEANDLGQPNTNMLVVL